MHRLDILKISAGFSQARGPSTLTSSLQKTNHTCQPKHSTDMILQGGPSGTEHLRKGAGPAMDQTVSPSGGIGLLVPWTLDSSQKNSRANRRGRVPLGASVRISPSPSPRTLPIPPSPFTLPPSSCPSHLFYLFWRCVCVCVTSFTRHYQVVARALSVCPYRRVVSSVSHPLRLLFLFVQWPHRCL